MHGHSGTHHTLNSSVPPSFSQFVTEAVLTTLAKKDENRLLRLANTIDINGSLRGQVFENRMHDSFKSCKSLTFARRALPYKPKNKSKKEEESESDIHVAGFQTFSALGDITLPLQVRTLYLSGTVCIMTRVVSRLDRALPVFACQTKLTVSVCSLLCLVVLRMVTVLIAHRWACTTSRRQET